MNRHETVKGPDTLIDAEHASRLLRVGLRGPSRPVDRLLDRMAEPDGAAWLARILADRSLAVLSAATDDETWKTLTPDDLVSLKEVKKTAAVRANSPEATLKALVGYFFSIALALAFFERNISSRGAEELSPALMDLASVTPPDWSSIFERAASVVSEKR